MFVFSKNVANTKLGKGYTERQEERFKRYPYENPSLSSLIQISIGIIR